LLPFLQQLLVAAEDISRPNNCIDWAGEAFKEARMSDKVEQQETDATDFVEELSDEALDRRRHPLLQLLVLQGSMSQESRP